jgi:hypothetical protein
MSEFSQSKFAAKLQNVVSQRREESGFYSEIAEKLPLASAGRLLDVGTGSGLQLKVIHEMEIAFSFYLVVPHDLRRPSSPGIFAPKTEILTG